MSLIPSLSYGGFVHAYSCFICCRAWQRCFHPPILPFRRMGEYRQPCVHNYCALHVMGNLAVIHMCMTSFLGVLNESRYPKSWLRKRKRETTTTLLTLSLTAVITCPFQTFPCSRPTSDLVSPIVIYRVLVTVIATTEELTVTCTPPRQEVGQGTGRCFSPGTFGYIMLRLDASCVCAGYFFKASAPTTASTPVRVSR